MNADQFAESREELEAACAVVLQAKGRDYAGEGGDRFANFKMIAELLNNFHVDVGTPMGTWAVYYMKHVFAILAWIGQRSESEPIKGRFVDARNYLDLGWGMVKEADINKPKAPYIVELPDLSGAPQTCGCGSPRCEGHQGPAGGYQG